MGWIEREFPNSKNLQIAPNKRATRARLDASSGDFMITLESGSVIFISPKEINGLGSAKYEELKDFEVPGYGYTIKWPALYVEVLVEDCVKLKSSMLG